MNRPDDIDATQSSALGDLLRRVVRLEVEEAAGSPSEGTDEWPHVDQLLRDAFALAGPLQPSLSLVDPVLASLRAEGVLSTGMQWPGWLRRTSLGLATVLLLLVGSGLAVLLAVGSATLGAFGVAGAAVWSSRALVLVFEAWSGLMATFSGAAATMRAVLLGEAAPVVGVSLLTGCIVVAVGFVLALRATQQHGPERAGEVWR